jgi:hypothetical protein
MRFGFKFVSIVSIAGVFAWAASAAPLQPSGEAQTQGFGYGYGAVKVTLCHVPPGNPGNAHTITVGAPAVAAHLAHGDTLGPCPGTLGATATTGQDTGKSKKQKPENGSENASAGQSENTNGSGAQEKSNNGKSKKNESPAVTVESTATVEVTTASTPEQTQKKPKKEKPAQSNGVDSVPTTDVSPGNANGHDNGNGGGNGNGQGNGKNK